MSAIFFICSILVFDLHLLRYSSGQTREKCSVSIDGISDRHFRYNENTTIRYHCRVSRASNITWYFQRLGEQTPLLIETYDGLLDGTTTPVEPAPWPTIGGGTVPSIASVGSIKERHLLVENENLTIYVAANDDHTWHRFQGKYTCAVDSECGPMNASVNIRPVDKDEDVTTVEPTAGTVVQEQTTTASTNDSTASPLSNLFTAYYRQIDNYLRNATGPESSEEILINIASSMSERTNSSRLTSEELIDSIVVVEKLAQLRKERDEIPVKRDEVNHVIETISNILEPKNAQAWVKANKTMASKLMTSADIYGGCLCRTTNETLPTIEDVRNIALESYCGFNMKLNTSISFWTNNGTDDRISIEMPTPDKNPLKDNSSLNIWSLRFLNINDYLPNTSNFLLDSRVLSLSTSEHSLALSFNITFRHNKVRRSHRVRRCVYWKTESYGGGDGDWSDDGCTVVTSDAHRTVCSCNHLTNFAVFMSRNPSKSQALSIISDILCIGSVLALVLTIVIHAVTWKHSKSHQQVLLLNLCCALIVAYFVFLVGSIISDRQEREKPVNLTGDDCKAVAVLLHYFFLAAFFMMLAEGIQLFVYVFFVFHARRTLETAMLVVTAWVLPMLIVVVSLSVTKAKGYGAGSGCWLSYQEEGSNHLIWTFIAPAFTVVAINSVIIVIVFVKLSRSRIASSKNDQRTKIRKMLWNVAVLCPVLGITWLIGILTMIDDNVVLQYIFAIFNGAQGIFIFIFHALFINEKFNEGLSSFCYQCIGSKKADKERILTKKPTAKKAKPSDLNLKMANYSGEQELDNRGFSQSSERLPYSVSSSSEKSPTSATVDTSLVPSPTSDTIDISYP